MSARVDKAPHRASLRRGAAACAIGLAVSVAGVTDTAADTPEAPAGVENYWDLERMIDQARYAPYEPSSLFDDGKVMRRPPEGTVPTDRVAGDTAYNQGTVAGAYVTQSPVPVTRALLQTGQDRFNRLCAACHGLAGDGESQVARAMSLRKPPTLVDARVQGFPPGRIFQVISEGYGLMRSYQEDLPIDDRWAVVAYVRALGMSRGVPLDALPPALRDRARKELP